VSSNFDESRFSAEIAELILSHTWFRRVWVLQELVFSKDLRVQVGRHRFSWIALHRAVYPQHRQIMAEPGRSAVSEGFRLLSEMHEAHQEHQKHERIRIEAWVSRTTAALDPHTEGSRMIDLLRSRRGLGVKYQKDMIFAHLGFASDKSELGQRINYSMNWEQVYHSFARYMIDIGLHCELFDELGGSDISTRSNGLPSWTPDWSTTSSGLRLLEYDWTSRVFGVNYRNTFYGGTDGEPRPDKPRHAFVYEPLLLACLGAKLDVVTQLGNAVSKLFKPYSESADLVSLRCWLRVIKPRLNRSSQLPEYGLEYNDLHDIICEPEPNSSVFDSFDSFKEMWESLGDKPEFGPSVFTLECVLQFHKAMMRILDPEFYDAQRWSSCLLALTTNGNFAFVPKCTQCGDLVAGLVLSSNTKMRMIANDPFLILRPIVAEDENLEALLTAKFQQKIRPILHCKLVGGCKMGTPEDEQDVMEQDPFVYDKTWKRVMAGSTAIDPNCLSDSSLTSTETRISRIDWYTFAIH
jgi:hypothetical protein